MMYNRHRCRCGECANAATEHARSYRYLIKIGKYNSGLVSAEPARKQIRRFMKAGYKFSHMAAASGLDYNTIQSIAIGFPLHGVQPRPRCRKDIADKIMNMHLSQDQLPARASIDSTGTIRRIQALHAIGWSGAELGRRVGIDKRNFINISKQDKITVRRASDIAKLYDELWNQVPDTSTGRKQASVTRAKARAEANNWPPPLAWDDDTIDNPNARPKGLIK